MFDPTTKKFKYPNQDSAFRSQEEFPPINPAEITILLVDDTPALLSKLEAFLQESGFRVMTAKNGFEALQRIEQERPDLILLDILMPGLDGFETCRRLKAQPATRNIPVIFLTALSELDDKIRGFELGGVDYILKPPQLQEVLVRVNTHLTIGALQRQLQHQNQLLQDKNIRLLREVLVRQQAEDEIESELIRYHTQLEKLAEQRIEELTQTNHRLQQEILEREHAEHFLRTSEQQYRALIEETTDGIEIFQQGKIVLANHALAAMLGYTPEQLLQLDPVDMFREDYRDLARQKIQLLDQQTKETWWEAPAMTKDGREFWGESRRRSILWDGQPASLITVRDITAQKLCEQTIKAEKAQLERENVTLRSELLERYKFGDIIGKSPAMQQVYQTIASAAASTMSVVIYGESGTGKELVARTIHANSERKDHPFVAVNCGAIPENLFEREFFGHRKGAFTGADRDQPGYLDRAHTGTLFLDEVSELSPLLQVKLLRVLQDGEYTPIGDSRSKIADVRLITATNKDLRDLLQSGGIREDFFYRIRVMTMTLPPLRERKEDIPLLLEHFWGHFGENHSSPPISGRIVDLFCTHDWPGNVRELQNELQRYLSEQRLEFVEYHEAASQPTGQSLSSTHPAREIHFREAVEDFEKRLLADALARHNGHQGKTAASLNIPPRTLYAKIKKYRLKSPRK